MCSLARKPVGLLSDPAAMLIEGVAGASQKRIEPQTPQNPRRALGDD
jgi:hypothetical protein